MTAEMDRRRQLAEASDIQELVSVSGPFRDAAKVYAWVVRAADPTPSPRLDRSRRSEFDRPAPHVHTQHARSIQESLEELFRNAADMAAAALDGEGKPWAPRDVCESCGQVRQGHRYRSKITLARRFLDELLADGRVEASQVLEQAREAGHAVKTIERASHMRPTIRKVKEHHRWWWSLPKAKPPSRDAA